MAYFPSPLPFPFLSLLFCSLVFGTVTYLSLPFDGTAHLNCSAVCGNSEANVTCIAGGKFIPVDNTLISNCCPVNVSVVLNVRRMLTNSDLGVTCDIRCGNGIVKTCNWNIRFTGVAPVSAINYNGNTGVLSWLPPTFYSDDIPQGEDTVYNVLVNGISVINTTGTSVWLNISNCSATAIISIIASVVTYQSSKNENFHINVCNVTLINNTEFYNSTEGKFGTNITSEVECNMKVCPFTCFMSLDYGDGTVSNDSFEVPPSDEKSVTVSHIINGLVPGTNRIEISFNFTEDILNLTIIVPSDSDEYLKTIYPKSFIPPTPSFQFSSTSSVSEGSHGIGISETSPVTSSPPHHGHLTAETVIIYVSAASAVVLILFTCILLLIICVCSRAYYRRVKKVVEKKEEVAIKISEGDRSNDDSSAVTETNSLNNTTAAVLATPTAIEMQEVTESGSNDSADISEKALKAIKSNPVAITDKPCQEASTVLSEERSYLKEADDCGNSQNNMEGGGKPPADKNDVMLDQTLSSDDGQLPFVLPQQVSANYSPQLKELEPD